mgnify:CR=1 FL=1
MRRLVMETSRLILRPLRSNDYKMWFEAYVLSLPAKNKWDRNPMKAIRCSRAEFDKVRACHALRAKDDKCYVYGVFTKAQPQLVGMIDISLYDRKTMKYANFGYQMFNRHWGHGYGQEAARAAVHIGLKQLKLQRLEASIDLDNKRSLRLVKAIGMHYEGVKKFYWCEKGKWQDQKIFIANPQDFKFRS